VIRLARLDDGKVVHIARWAETMQWRSECNRLRFAWENGKEVGVANRWGASPRPAVFDVLDRPLCLDCLRRAEADWRQVMEWHRSALEGRP